MRPILLLAAESYNAKLPKTPAAPAAPAKPAQRLPRKQRRKNAAFNRRLARNLQNEAKGAVPGTVIVQEDGSVHMTVDTRAQPKGEQP
jgi:hypothetical protein